ncbi:MAG: response regulator [Rhodanobacter sp.]
MTVAEAPCVLVVEDEIMISMLLEDRLEHAGYRVLLAANVKDALELARHAALDVAVLDVNLDGATSFPVAEALRQRGIAFTFASGYGISGVPPEYRGDNMLQKPYDARALLGTLSRLRGLVVGDS